MPTQRKTAKKARPSRSRAGGKAGRPASNARAAKPAGKARPPKPARPAVSAKRKPEAASRSAARPAAARPAARPIPSRPAPPPRPGAGEAAQPVTAEDLKEFERRLLDERGRVMKEMGYLETTVLKSNQRDSSGDLSGYSFHMADVGTDAMEREKAFLFASAEGRLLLEIDGALRRLYQGRYGECESCGRPIARARLEAMPHARLCVSCKEKEERRQLPSR